MEPFVLARRKGTTHTASSVRSLLVFSFPREGQAAVLYRATEAHHLSGLLSPSQFVEHTFGTKSWDNTAVPCMPLMCLLPMDNKD